MMLRHTPLRMVLSLTCLFLLRLAACKASPDCNCSAELKVYEDKMKTKDTEIGKAKEETAKCKEECKDLEHQTQNLNSRLKESTEENGELRKNLTHWAEKNAVIGQKADAAQGALDAVERRFLGSIAVIFILFVLYQQASSKASSYKAKYEEMMKNQKASSEAASKHLEDAKEAASYKAVYEESKKNQEASTQAAFFKAAFENSTKNPLTMCAIKTAEGIINRQNKSLETPRITGGDGRSARVERWVEANQRNGNGGG